VCHPYGHRCLPSRPVAGSFGVRLNGRAFPVEPGAAGEDAAVGAALLVEEALLAVGAFIDGVLAAGARGRNGDLAGLVLSGIRGLIGWYPAS
jgi:hypothetical protein